ncbi:aspartate transaminase [Phaeovulum sp. W22_SRMD_FR3]|uniref:aspartate transaminase n=1 Tax=Phaeovulum sp. W22_SRMD_FR3 TaxID=3240274 RepID=UPI003F9D82EC
MTIFKPAARVTRIKPSPSTAAAARATELRAAGVDLIDMTVGEPDFDTPESVKAAAVAAIAAGDTKYTPVNGTPALRRAIIARMQRRLGVTVDPAAISVGGGAKQIIFLTFMAAVEAGDEVLIPAPYWVSYPDMVLANEGSPVILPCPGEDGFKLTPAALEAAITPKTRWLVLNAPSNPTGAAYSAAELATLAEVLRRHPQVWVLTDEIYDEIWFEPGQITSLLTVAPDLAERLIVINGVSKTYAMTGWRLGYAVGPKPLIAAINKLQSQMSSCPSSISQAAAVAALGGDQGFLAEMVTEYKARRDLAVDLLNAVPGLHCSLPQGAFYLYPNCAGAIGKTTPAGKVIETDLDFTLYLLDCGVAAIHGGAYGLSPYFRISFATSRDALREGCARIAAAMAALT